MNRPDIPLGRDPRTSRDASSRAGADRPTAAERRAAAARRRALLTGVLLLVVLGTGVGAGIGPVPAWVPVVAGVLLVAVLVAGRRAVLAQQRRGAGAEGEERRGEAENIVATQVIARVRPGARVTAADVRGELGVGAGGVGDVEAVGDEAEDVHEGAGERPGRARADGSVEERNEAGDEGDGGASSRGADGGARGFLAERPAAAPVRGGAAARGGAGSEETVRGDGASDVTARDRAARGDGLSADAERFASRWEPREVPRPVYTLKAPAPRWEPTPWEGMDGEPAGLGAEGPAVSEESVLRGGVGADGVADVSGQVELSAASAGVGEAAGAVAGAVPEPVATTAEPPAESLGTDLNAILARRRAVGS